VQPVWSTYLRVEQAARGGGQLCRGALLKVMCETETPRLLSALGFECCCNRFQDHFVMLLVESHHESMPAPPCLIVTQ
jgi:hypothetical protein